MDVSNKSQRSIGLRPATSSDAPLLLEIYTSTRADEMALVPWWTGEQKASFVQMQSDAQHKHYRNNYPQAQYLIVTVNDRPAGRLYLAEKESELRILDLTLLPDERNQGVGSYLLNRLIEDSTAKKKALEIHVENFSPALRLLERLGFVNAQENGIYFLMKREAGNNHEAIRSAHKAFTDIVD